MRAIWKEIAGSRKGKEKWWRLYRECTGRWTETETAMKSRLRRQGQDFEKSFAVNSYVGKRASQRREKKKKKKGKLDAPGARGAGKTQ